MGKKRKKRRQSHGAAWPLGSDRVLVLYDAGTKKRVALFDENGERIRGKGNKEAAEVALAKEKIARGEDPVVGCGPSSSYSKPQLVARVCSDYIQYCERGLVSGSISKSHRDNTVRWLNDLCESL